MAVEAGAEAEAEVEVGLEAEVEAEGRGVASSESVTTPASGSEIGLGEDYESESESETGVIEIESVTRAIETEIVAGELGVDQGATTACASVGARVQITGCRGERCTEASKVSATMPMGVAW